MKIPNGIKRLLSYFTSKPIEKGIGVSCDDSFTLPRDIGFETIEGTTVHRGTFFVQKPVEGLFELVGFAKSGESSLYQLKHRYSGATFNVTRQMLDFLFVRNDK